MKPKITMKKRILLAPSYLWFAAVLLISPVMAQDSDRRKRNRRKDQVAAPRPVSLVARDGIKLRAWYFESNQGKDAIPVMLVHEWNSQASPYQKLAMFLQKNGFAVLVPEYRGHGASKTYTARNGKEENFNTDRMSRHHVQAIVTADLESAKGFLKDENNDEKLNLNALTLIGVGEGSIFAALWAQRDWAFPSVGRVKQGQDVKAMVYLSPVNSFKGLKFDGVLRDPNMLRLPTLVIAGADHDRASEAKRIVKQIEIAKRRMSRGAVKDFKSFMVPGGLYGHALIDEVGAVTPTIVKFIQEHVKTDAEANAWVERK